MSVIWTIIIGFIVGVIAKFIMPGDKTEPTGFILTSVLGIVGAFVATYLGQAVGWYKAGESAGFFASVVGAIILLFLYGIVAGRQGRACLDINLVSRGLLVAPLRHARLFPACPFSGIDRKSSWSSQTDANDRNGHRARD